MNILTVNRIFSTLVFWIASRLYLVPRPLPVNGLIDALKKARDKMER